MSKRVEHEKTKRGGSKTRTKKPRQIKRSSDEEIEYKQVRNTPNIENETLFASEEEKIRDTIDKKTIMRLKRKINSWMDYDDKIKILNAKAKKYKDAKKQQEESILAALTNIEKNRKPGDVKIDVVGEGDTMRGCVYRYESENKEPLTENVVKGALMEHFGNEKKVKELLKKIDKKRPIKKRYYLKRTKGINKN